MDQRSDNKKIRNIDWDDWCQECFGSGEVDEIDPDEYKHYLKHGFFKSDAYPKCKACKGTGFYLGE